MNFDQEKLEMRKSTSIKRWLEYFSTKYEEKHVFLQIFFNISHIALTSFIFCHNNSRLWGITITFRLWKFAAGFHNHARKSSWHFLDVNLHIKQVLVGHKIINQIDIVPCICVAALNVSVSCIFHKISLLRSILML